MPRVFVPAILSGVLLWAAFFPLNLGFLGFFALVPWLSLVRADVSRRRRYFAAYLGGVVFFALATQWIRVAHPMMYLSWLGLTIVTPVTWVLALALIRRFDRRGVPLTFAVPVVWVMLEYLRMHFPIGFPFLQPLGVQHMFGFGWYFLGYTQHTFLPLIQIADLGGVYAVSFVVAAVNGWLADRILPSSVVRRALRWNATSPTESASGTTRPVWATLCVLLLLVGSLAYGFVQLQHPAFADGPRVTALQGNVPQDEKILRSGLLVTSYRKLFEEANAATPRTDLVIWPETCFADDWFEISEGETADPEFAKLTRRRQANFATAWWPTPTLLGLNSLVWEDGRAWKYNSALLIDTQGQKLGRYDKMHLVPFGEYVPLGNVLPFMSMFTPYDHDYSCRPGESWTRFPLRTADNRAFTFGTLICYEDSDPSLAREYVRTNPVDFLVNISNDGWFRGSEEHEQHLAICRFRAIETRRAVMRAVNMGISGVIDSDGRVVALPGETWASSKQTEAIVSAVVPLDNRASWYPVLGDWLPLACSLVVLVVLLRGWFRRG